jgi:hypothetical protein
MPSATYAVEPDTWRFHNYRIENEGSKTTAAARRVGNVSKMGDAAAKGETYLRTMIITPLAK